MNYLYHMIPLHIEGDTLMPLNDLRKKYPRAYKRAVEKYKERKYLLKIRIPSLDCLWNDVLHLTAVHPSKIDSALKKAGYANGLLNTPWFKIDPRILDPELTTVYLYNQSKKRFAENNFTDFNIKDLNRYNSIKANTITYYREEHIKNETPLLFHLIPHILYKGSIKLKDMEKLK